nr:hypothetical protein [Pseudobacteriovorax antillogorgiicola]
MIQALFKMKTDSTNPLLDWRQKKLPQTGKIGNFEYAFHGMGVSLEEGDFDADIEFGNEGAFGYFDAWRLICFARNYEEFSELNNQEEISLLLTQLKVAGYIKRDQDCWTDELYRVCD